jgi:glycosyltransferase involved in cell wall biosynthesis
LYTSEQEADEIRTLAPRLDSVLAERIHISRSIWNCVRALPGQRPFQACYSWSPNLARRLVRLAAQGRFDVVHVEHLRGVRYGLLLKRSTAHLEDERPAVVWDSVDCISSLFRHAAEESVAGRSRLAAKLELRRTESYEGRLVSRFDRVLVTSGKDRLDLLKLADQWGPREECGSAEAVEQRVSVVPNGVDLEYFSPPVEPREPQTIVISGKMSYHANVTAVVHFVNEVMPKIWSQLPDVRLWVVGKDPPREVRGLGVPWSNENAVDGARDHTRQLRVLVTGTVGDIRPFLRRATVAVAPTRYGVGIQNKVLEALACGLPVVATPEAVSALDVRSGRELLVARDANELATSVLALLRDPQLRSKLGREGRLLVERQHEWRSVARDLTQIYLNATQRPMAYVGRRGRQ